MVRRLIIICFLIVILLQLNLHRPTSAEARMLLDDIPKNDTGNSTNTEGKGQSKSGVTGSESRHAGSATNDTPPESTATVQMPPPTAVTTTSYVHVVHVSPSGNSYNYYSHYQWRSQDTGFGGHNFETKTKVTKHKK